VGGDAYHAMTVGREMKRMECKSQKKALCMSVILPDALLLLAIGAALVACPPNSLLTDVEQRVNDAQGGGTVATPLFSPAPSVPGGTYTSSSDMTVTITDSTPGAVIHYTTDGSTPSVSTPVYAGPISVPGNGTTETIKAIGTKGGMTDSPLAAATYTINYSQVSTPQFSLAGGTYTSDQTVKITCATSGATIYYTTNGTDPTTASPTYTAAISVAGDGTVMTIKAIAAKAGMNTSTVASVVYSIYYLIRSCDKTNLTFLSLMLYTA
jgi:hypothetical protein